MLRIISILTVAVAVLVSGKYSNATILPPNNLHLEDTLKAANITKEEFEEITDQIVSYFKPLAKLHGADELQANKLWDDSTVNANASQRVQGGKKVWIINMFGGLARRPEVTPDGFALVVCHELGHHFGGFPFHARDIFDPPGSQPWAASEGQSDYFATQACARKIWGHLHAENEMFRAIVDPVAKDMCDQSWHSEDSQNLCYRVALAGHSLGHLLSILRRSGVPQFDTPDRSQVSQTYLMHPEAQCRLDTYLAGALCSQRFDLTVIPGRNEKKGQASKEAEHYASFYSCSPSEGYRGLEVRPSCWFKSVLDSE